MQDPAPTTAPAPQVEARCDGGIFVAADAPPDSYGPPGGSALYNPVTGQGIAGRDSGVAYRWRSPRRLGDGEIEAITVEGIGRRGVSIRGWEATREWGRVTAQRSELPATTTARVLQWLELRAEQLRLRGRACDLQRERERWGDSALILAIGEDVKTWQGPAPQASAGVDAVRVRSLRVLRGRGRDYRPTAMNDYSEPEWGEASEISIATLAIPANPEDAQWGTLNMSPYTSDVRVHASRFHRISTVDGRSDLDGVSQRLAELIAAARGAARIASRPAIPAIEGRNMGAQLRADRERAKGAYGRAMAEAGEEAPLLLDLMQGEKLQYVGPPGGLSVVEPITGLGFMLAAAWGIPMTLLFGMSPGGLNSPGDAEERNWNNVVRSVQAELAAPVLEVYRALAIELAATLLELAARDDKAGDAAAAEERRGIAKALEGLDLAFEWAPLRVLSATEDADWQAKVSTTHKTYVDLGVLRPEEIRASAFGGERFAARVSLIERSNNGEVQKPIAVGTATAALTIVQAFYAGSIPEGPARALLQVLDPVFRDSAIAMIDASAKAPNPVAPPVAGGAPPPTLDGPKLPAVWSEPEIRRALQVGKRTIARWVEEGKLRAFDAGNGHRKYSRAEVIALWEGDPQAQQEVDARAVLDALDELELEAGRA